MREMKDSGIEWIGQIPKDWDVVPHKRVMHKVKKICEQYSGEDIISLTMNGVIKRDLTAGGKMPTSFDGYQYVKPNDLLLCLFDIDVTPRCVGVVKDYGVTSPAYSRFVMHDGYYNAYYDYLLRAIDDDKVFVHLSKNLRSSLTESDFGAIKTCVPSLAEQKRIVTFLDAQCAEIDAVLEKTRASIEEYKKLKQAVITQAVTKGIRGDRPMKDSGIEWIGEIPAEWKVNLIKNVATTGSGGTPESGNPSLYDGDINWICSYDLKERPITKSERRLTQLGADSIAGNVQLKGSVLVAMYGGSGTIGNSGILECEAKTNQAICSIKFNNGYITDYFGFYYILSIRKYWMLFAVGTRKDPNISQDIVRKMPCILPPIAEQEEIVAYCNKACDQLDTLITKKQQYLTEIENYKKSLIYEYVTGKREV